MQFHFVMSNHLHGIITNRKSIRLKGYDYSQNGVYFITVCTHQRECMFGKIVDEKLDLNECGRIVESCWNEIPMHFSNVELDAYVVMPNHLHGIITIVGAGSSRPLIVFGRENRAPTLGKIVAYFKYATTKHINELQKTGIRKCWQRNYYEHIIRSEQSLEKIREYICNNPYHWKDDELFV